MKFRLLILGVLVHGLLLLWSFDVFMQSENAGVICPFPNNRTIRRVILTIVRNPNQVDQINGISHEFLISVPILFYYGDGNNFEYFNISKLWLNNNSIWNNNLEQDLENYFDTFKNNFYSKLKDQSLFILVLHDNIEDRKMFYIKRRLKQISDIMDNYYGNKMTTCLIFYEENNNLWSFGFDIADKEEQEAKLNNPESLVPLMSILLNINVKYYSLAILPVQYLVSSVTKSYGLYCNALNILDIAQKAKQRVLGIIRYLYQRNTLLPDVSNISVIERLLEESSHTEAIELSKKLRDTSMHSYTQSRQILHIMTFVLIIITIAGWILILCMEYIELLSPTKFITATNCRNYVIHICFLLLSMTLMSVPIIQKWPYTFHLYFQAPILMFWLFTLRYQRFSYLNCQFNFPFNLVLFVLALFLMQEYILAENKLILPLSICIVSCFPSLPKFRKVPFLFIIGWFAQSVLILTAFYLTEVYGKNINKFGNNKYINLSGTIWIMLSGISILWVSPRRDAVITCFMTVALGFAIWLQNLCFTASVTTCHIIMICVWPLFSIIFLPLFGKSVIFNKIIHCVLAAGVLVMITSTAIEPLTFLLIVSYTASWAVVESYYTLSNWDNLRRAIILLYIFLLTEHLTATNHFAYKCIICDIDVNTELFILIITFVRLAIIYTGILATYRLILGGQIYSTAILISLVFGFAALRKLLTFTNHSLLYHKNNDYLRPHIRLNSIAIVFYLIYNAVMFYARNNKHLKAPSLESFELIEL